MAFSKSSASVWPADMEGKDMDGGIGLPGTLRGRSIDALPAPFSRGRNGATYTSPPRSRDAVSFDRVGASPPKSRGNDGRSSFQLSREMNGLEDKKPVNPYDQWAGGSHDSKKAQSSSNLRKVSQVHVFNTVRGGVAHGVPIKPEPGSKTNSRGSIQIERAAAQVMGTEMGKNRISLDDAQQIQWSAHDAGFAPGEELLDIPEDSGEGVGGGILIEPRGPDVNLYRYKVKLLNPRSEFFKYW
mmetsp:Transcript_40449/g.128883  ORF Transcript_40449/g.128883 Transcript_40449/m.128883 type:complete len:242 (-) Transcript_40449:132-857(-)